MPADCPDGALSLVQHMVTATQPSLGGGVKEQQEFSAVQQQQVSVDEGVRSSQTGPNDQTPMHSGCSTWSQHVVGLRSRSSTKRIGPMVYKGTGTGAAQKH
jgi:hypothetical protein